MELGYKVSSSARRPAWSSGVLLKLILAGSALAMLLAVQRYDRALSQQQMPFAVYAVSYGESRFPEAYVFYDRSNASLDATLPFGWLFYAIRDVAGGWTLIDAGFHDTHLRTTEWALTSYADPLTLLAVNLGVKADDVHTLIITHHHVDHAGSMLRFPAATLVMHSLVAAELRKPENVQGITDVHDGAIDELAAQGRLRTFESRWSDPIPLDVDMHHRLRIESIGGHAPGSCMVWIDHLEHGLERPVALLTGDEIYLPQNYLTGRPTGTTVDVKRSASAVEEIRRAAAEGTFVFTYHDPDTVQGLGTRRVL